MMLQSVSSGHPRKSPLISIQTVNAQAKAKKKWSLIRFTTQQTRLRMTPHASLSTYRQAVANCQSSDEGETRNTFREPDNAVPILPHTLFLDLIPCVEGRETKTIVIQRVSPKYLVVTRCRIRRYGCHDALDQTLQRLLTTTTKSLPTVFSSLCHCHPPLNIVLTSISFPYYVQEPTNWEPII